MSQSSRTPSNRVPAEHPPLGSYLLEEMQERGWTSAEVARRIGGTEKEIGIWELTVDMLIFMSDRPDVILGQDTADALGKAFDTSPEYWSNLHNGYRTWAKAKGVHVEAGNA